MPNTVEGEDGIGIPFAVAVGQDSRFPIGHVPSTYASGQGKSDKNLTGAGQGVGQRPVKLPSAYLSVPILRSQGQGSRPPGIDMSETYLYARRWNSTGPPTSRGINQWPR